VTDLSLCRAWQINQLLLHSWPTILKPQNLIKTFKYNSSVFSRLRNRGNATNKICFPPFSKHSCGICPAHTSFLKSGILSGSGSTITKFQPWSRERFTAKTNYVIKSILMTMIINLVTLYYTYIWLLLLHANAAGNKCLFYCGQALPSLMMQLFIHMNWNIMKKIPSSQNGLRKVKGVIIRTRIFYQMNTWTVYGFLQALRPKKNICVFMVTWPTLFFSRRP
jgi:hypothetical protein